jgi:hypothetical protein
MSEPVPDPSNSQELHRLVELLAGRASAGDTPRQLVDLVVDSWSRIDAALKPIVGSRAVAMLLKRSLFLTGSAHPWLAEGANELPEVMDLDALRRLLAGRTSVDVAAAGGLLLKTFEALLASLVGSSLTERLLRSVWANLLSGAAAKDSPP